MISFGSDPEFMLTDAKGNLRSAIGIVPGTKEEHHDMGDGQSAYFDNVLAECSIRPEKSAEASVESFRQCFMRYADLVSPLRLTPRAAATYPEAECKHPEALKFGCSPDFDCYALEMNDAPDCNGTFRTGGGHIHIGFEGGADISDEEPDFEELNFKIAWDRIWVARMCELFIGIPSLILDKDPTSAERRNLYGKAGAHRACSKYGVEYRSIGNFWLARPSLVELMFDLSSACAKAVTVDEVHETIWEDEINPEEVRSAINTGTANGFAKFEPVLKKYLSADLMSRITSESQRPHSYDMYTQWGLKVKG